MLILLLVSVWTLQFFLPCSVLHCSYLLQLTYFDRIIYCLLFTARSRTTRTIDAVFKIRLCCFFQQQEQHRLLLLLDETDSAAHWRCTFEKVNIVRLTVRSTERLVNSMVSIIPEVLLLRSFRVPTLKDSWHIDCGWNFFAQTSLSSLWTRMNEQRTLS